MSQRTLRKAARMKGPFPDIETRITLLLVADRTDRRGRFSVPSDQNDEFHADLARETNAVVARLAGDPLVRFGVDNARVTRVLDAMREADDQ